MKYTYPITNIFTMYNFDYPRYVRLFIELFKLLLNYIICILFFYLIIDDNINDNMNNIVFSFIFFGISLGASFILYIIVELITRKFLGYDKERRDIWKPRLESIRRYIFYNIKKDILFNSKWYGIRNRLISFTRICGECILKRKPTDKYKIYADNKNRYNKLNENKSQSSSFSMSQNSSEKDRDSEKNLSNSLKYQRSGKAFFLKKNDIIPTSRLCIEKRVQSFSFSKFGQNNLKLKTVQKIEDIRNNYILNINEEKFDETLEIKKGFVKTYNNLEIETLDNYTYISTDSINNQLNNSSSENNKIFINILGTFLLLLFLALIDIGIIFLKIFKIAVILEKENYNYKTNIFIMTVTFQVLVFNLLVNYLFSLCISIFIFSSYGYEKKTCFNKLIYRLFVEKYIKYIYRIRLLINKYSKDLDFIK